MYWRSLSVCPVPDPKSRTEGRSKLNIDRKGAHDTDDPWPHFAIERLKVKVTRPLNAVNENQPYLRNGKDDELETRCADGVYDDPHRRHESSAWLFKSPLAGGGGMLWRPHYRAHSLHGCSSHHLQGAGVCCGAPTTGRTACMAVQVTICRGRGYIVAAPVQSTHWDTLSYWSNSSIGLKLCMRQHFI